MGHTAKVQDMEVWRRGKNDRIPRNKLEEKENVECRGRRETCVVVDHALDNLSVALFFNTKIVRKRQPCLKEKKKNGSAVFLF